MRRKIEVCEPSPETMVEEITSIIHNRPLASAIYRSVASALGRPFVHLVPGATVWDVFKMALDAAIRDIEEHPRGKLFRRLIEYGPQLPDDGEPLVSDGESILSDDECGSCVEFIYSHMVNRFKGELAELLALEPCIRLVGRLQQDENLPSDIHLYWGDMVQERRQTRIRSEAGNMRWGGFTKGADGLLVEHISVQPGHSHNALRIHGVVEVKSMTLAKTRVITQINRHYARLGGGVQLGEKRWPPDEISFPGVTRIMVLPSTWRLSREWRLVKTDEGSEEMVFPEPCEPPRQTQIEEMGPGLWKITLAWSQEALNQAAYEMTFWYMSQVGRHIYTKKNLPKEWAEMTPEEAGYNAIKMMLYYILLRPLSKRKMRLATRLYNVYCFGYPLGVDSKEMLWPKDFS
jgi:hypothetical protein